MDKNGGTGKKFRVWWYSVRHKPYDWWEECHDLREPCHVHIIHEPYPQSAEDVVGVPATPAPSV